MKKILLSLVCFIFSFLGFSQEIQGIWEGELEVFGNKLPLVFHINQENSNYSAKMDSPQQQAFGIPVDEIRFEENTLLMTVNSIGMNYEGILNEDANQFSGTFKQSGMKFPMELKKSTGESSFKPNRPQEPVKPYPYQSEEVIFPNKKEGFNLAGTLTFPKKSGKYPAVILITGSGPQNRDEELMGHKPFLVIADYLTRNGIAVLRYDDRGVAESEGNFENSTTADFATDALAAFEFLRNHPSIKSDQIGLIGHSEGGLVAIKSAAQNKEIAFIGLLASSTMDGGKILLKQQEDIERISGFTEKYIQENKRINAKAYDLIRNIQDSTELRQQLSNHFNKAVKAYPDWNISKTQGVSDEQYVETLLDIYMDKWWRYFISYDPIDDLKKIDQPIFALNGNKDLQVNADENLKILKNLNKNISIHPLENLNHLFQESKTGNPSEYAMLEETFSPKALAIILEEIQRILK